MSKGTLWCMFWNFNFLRAFMKSYVTPSYFKFFSNHSIISVILRILCFGLPLLESSWFSPWIMIYEKYPVNIGVSKVQLTHLRRIYSIFIRPELHPSTCKTGLLLQSHRSEHRTSLWFCNPHVP